MNECEQRIRRGVKWGLLWSIDVGGRFLPSEWVTDGTNILCCATIGGEETCLW